MAGFYLIGKAFCFLINFAQKPFMNFEQKQEFANVITHAIGIFLTLIGAFFLLNLGIKNASNQQTIGLALFLFSLLAVYTASTVYHSVWRKSLKPILKKIDHIAIYLLIGGTHTPFVLLYENNSFGKYYLLTLWGLIVLGILYKIFLIGKWQWVSLAFYIFLGWMAVFIIPRMMDDMPDSVFTWILVGGLSYTAGTVFYALERIPYNHAIWHLFVLAGSIGHYIAIYLAYN